MMREKKLYNGYLMTGAQLGMLRGLLATTDGIEKIILEWLLGRIQNPMKAYENEKQKIIDKYTGKDR